MADLPWGNLVGSLRLPFSVSLCQSLEYVAVFLHALCLDAYFSVVWLVRHAASVDALEYRKGRVSILSVKFNVGLYRFTLSDAYIWKALFIIR